jgi:outer membrane protein assembly factor BamB
MRCLRSFVVFLVCASSTAAADWPQWLGPDRNGHTSEKVAAWKGDLKVLWRQPVGEGHSSPIVADGKVFLHTKVKGKDEEEVAAYDAKTGKELWRTGYKRAPFTSLFGTGPQATPTFADGQLYAYGVTGVLTCLDADGKQVWQVDTAKEFKPAKRVPADFGVASSPLVEGDHVLVMVGGQGAGVVAFHRKTGAVAWKALDDRASYSSPIGFGTGKDRQAVFLTAVGLTSLRPSDGKVLWKYPLADKLMESSSTPLKTGDVLMAGSITFGSIGVKLDEKGGETQAKEAWKNEALTCYFSSPVAIDAEHVFLITNTNPLGFAKPVATLRCIESKTGKELWNKPAIGKYHVAMIRTGDGKVLFLDDATNLILIDPSPKEYRELARTKLCGEMWAHPALSGGRLYVRDEKELLCVQLGE